MANEKKDALLATIAAMEANSRAFYGNTATYLTNLNNLSQEMATVLHQVREAKLEQLDAGTLVLSHYETIAQSARAVQQQVMALEAGFSTLQSSYQGMVTGAGNLTTADEIRVAQDEQILRQADAIRARQAAATTPTPEPVVAEPAPIPAPTVTR